MAPKLIADTTPRSTGFKVGIPYVYALKVRFITTRGERPREEPADVFDGDGSATAYSRIPSSADLHARVPLRASA